MSPDHGPSLSHRAIWGAWIGLGAVLLFGALSLVAASPRFAPDEALFDMPALEFAAALTGLSIFLLMLLPLIRATLSHGLGNDAMLLWFMLGLGLLVRVTLFFSEPAFETDWNRYLWDGAVTANGYNPYSVSPDDAQGEAYHYTLQPLAHASGTVIERVNHSHLKTIYPPVAQAAFALAYGLKPFSLEAWRAVLLISELVTAALLVGLLFLTQRSPLWVALYWWNPVAAKEIINAAHMEGIIFPLVLLAMLLALKARPLASIGALGVAAGAKLWPVLLAPLLLRPLWGQRGQLWLAFAILAGLLVIWVIPVIAGGVDTTSGFVAFTRYWRTNSAHFPLFESLARHLFTPLNLDATVPGVAVKAVLAAAAMCSAVWIARREVNGPLDLMDRAALTVGVLFLLSPVQFPWYALWMLPFLCFSPSLSLLAAVALTPIYYASFYFLARDSHEVYRAYVIWLIWIPVWTLFAAEIWRSRRSGPEEPVHA